MSTLYQSNAHITSKEELVSDDVKKKSSSFVYLLTFLSTMGAFLFGYDTGVVSGAMLLIKRDFRDMSDLWHESIVSGTIAAALVFALIGGWLSDQFGRKPAILVASVVFTVGAIVMGASNNKETLLAGRLIVGIGVGLTSVAVPQYLEEITSREINMMPTYIALITFGQFVASCMAGALSNVSPNGWRYMLGLSAIPAFLQFCGFLFMPETPRWLASKKRYNEALKVLRSIRGSGSSVDQEMAGIRAVCEDQEREIQEQLMLSGGKPLIFQVLRSPSVRRALILGCILHAVQQLSGINTVMYYSATIIRTAGVRDETLAIWLSAVVAAVNFVVSFMGIFLVNRVGRRVLTLSSLAGVVASLVVLGVCFELMSTESPFVTQVFNNSTCSVSKTCGDCIDSGLCGFCFSSNSNGTILESSCWALDQIGMKELPVDGPCAGYEVSPQPIWAVGWCPSSFYWLPVAAMSLYLVSFAPGMGPMPWTICSEIYPLWARGLCTSITTCTNWSMNLLVSMTFLSLMQIATKQGTFYLYAAIAALGLVILWAILPETQGRTLEEMESLFLSPWFSLRRRSHVTGSLSGNNVQYVHIRGLNRASPRSSTRPGELDPYNSDDSDN